jgi:hypothetical protein
MCNRSSNDYRTTINMDEGKVMAMLNWPKPTTVKELQWFSNYYCQFIRKYK